MENNHAASSDSEGLDVVGAQAPFEPKSIPDAIRTCQQWVCWKLIPADGPTAKPRKVPIDPKTGSPASATGPETWGSFDDALSRASADRLAGIGFVFTVNGPFTGVDLDHCRDPATGAIEPWAEEIVQKLASYTEVSPSGTGLHVLVQARLPKGGRRRGRVEMYDRGRYFTVTGQRLPTTPTTIEPRQAEIDALHAKTFSRRGKEPKPKKTARSSAPLTLDRLRETLRDDDRRRFDALWSGDFSAYPSQSEADLELCRLLATVIGDDAEAIDRWFRESKLLRAKWDEQHGERTYGAMTIAKALSLAEAEAEETSDKPSVSSQLLEMVADAGVAAFCDRDGIAYATVAVGDHQETHTINGRAFKQWLRRLYYKNTGRPLAANPLTDVCGVLDAYAQFDGEQRDVFVRVAELDGTIYVDLCNRDWEVVAVTEHGWEITKSAPVTFRRARSMHPLPRPVPGGNVEQLRHFVNCSDEDWPALLGCLISYFRPNGPFPVLSFLGEQGSAKSTSAKVLRRLIDPNGSPLRSSPSDDRDLMIAAKNSWLFTLDNMSSIPDWLSDALCRLATGGGFATRELYSNDEEAVFAASRPVIITGIGDVVGRSDLLDRSVLCYAPRIPEERRRSERELWREFEEACPLILGALLDGVSVGLRRHRSIRLEAPPRLADFAIWATACEPGLGLLPGAFMRSFQRSHESSIEVALESNPIAQPIRDLVEKHGGSLSLTATQLLAELNEALLGKGPPSGWPRSARALSMLVRRAAPDLRALGYALDFERASKDQDRARLIVIRRGPDRNVLVSPEIKPRESAS